MAAEAISDAGLNQSGASFERTGKSRATSSMLMTGSVGSTTRYFLRCHRTSDMTWQRWISNTVDLSDAPGMPGDYDSATLTIESKVVS